MSTVLSRTATPQRRITSSGCQQLSQAFAFVDAVLALLAKVHQHDGENAHRPALPFCNIRLSGIGHPRFGRDFATCRDFATSRRAQQGRGVRAAEMLRDSAPTPALLPKRLHARHVNLGAWSAQ